LRKIHISFLWHMHQPNYRDAVRGYYTMPWVRLHATKAYYDMAVLAGKFPEMGQTFNLVPSLLEQIEDYANGAEDFELMLSRKRPVDLTADEKEAILLRFFQGNRETMIKPLPRYMELLQYRGVNGTRHEIASALKKFAAQDYLDLQVLFNLSWFGFAALEEDVELRRLRRKGRFYSEDDREYVLEKQIDIAKAVTGRYRKLWAEGKIDVTASPFYHPILPLLCDTSVARVGMPGCLLPKRPYRQPGDAAAQVGMSLDYFEEKLGRRPAGMWPSEGSVSPQALAIMKDAGIAWVATDEDILAKSTKGYNRAADLYRPWDADGITVFFRDHELSDKIGFVYSRNPAKVAVDDFVGRLAAIASNKARTDRADHVSVILDGENPWEYFPGSGREFLETLFARIIAEKSLVPVSFTGYLEKNPPKGKISSIFPGSWINGNFDTWIGDIEEANGWDALNNAREKLVEREGRLTDEEKREAWREIYRAEGSDWFWWYGEDHTSPNDPEFDRLFRTHLERVYTILGIDPPEEITEPIITKQLVRTDIEPTGLVTPVIDGKSTTFYEWLSAGWVPTAGPAGAMSGGQPVISAIYYGFDLSNLYLRLDFTVTEEPPDLSKLKLSIVIENGEKYRADISLAKPDTYTLYRDSKGRWVRRARRTEVALERVLEIAVAFEDIAAAAGERVNFGVMLYENDIERERWPVSGRISFVVPDENFESKMWQV